MSLLYYIPNETTGIDLAGIREAGLGYVFDRPASWYAAAVNGGPDGELGVLLAVKGSRELGSVAYRMKEQEWRRVPGTSCWVGRYLNEYRPGPRELARDAILNGHPVRLMDGNEWSIPVARGLSVDGGELVPYCALPRMFDVNDEGEWIAGDPHRRYAPLWDAALRILDVFLSVDTTGERVTINFAEQLDICAVAIGTNYRVGKGEIGMLGLLDATRIMKVLAALIDGPSFEAFKKKEDQDGSSTASGSAVSLGTTDQP